EDGHPAVEPALLGQVTPCAPGELVGGAATPRDRPRIRREDVEDDAHRRRLASAVRAEEAEDGAGLDRERDAVERDDVAEALAQGVDLEGHRGGSGLCRVAWRIAAHLSNDRWRTSVSGTPTPPTPSGTPPVRAGRRAPARRRRSRRAPSPARRAARHGTRPRSAGRTGSRPG